MNKPLQREINITNLFNLRASPKGEVGIEIEVESRASQLPHGDDLAGTVWRSEMDGSLRGNSQEYIFRKPLLQKHIPAALKALKNIFDDNESHVDYSFRAGVHVHINVSSLPMDKVVNFITSYYIFENLLMDFCGEDRVGNHFCLRVKDAEFVLQGLIEALNNGNAEFFIGDNIRYASLNLNALSKFGSLEFRGLSTFENFDKIEEWVNILCAIKQQALKYNNPKEIIYQYSFLGPEDFMKAFLGRSYSTLLKMQGWSEKLNEGMRFAQDLAYLSNTKKWM